MRKPMSGSAIRQELTVASMPGRKDTDLRYRPHKYGGEYLDKSPTRVDGSVRYFRYCP